MQDYDKALILWAIYRRGVIKYLLGQNEGAIQDLTRSIGGDLGFEKARTYLMNIYWNQGKYYDYLKVSIQGKNWWRPCFMIAYTLILSILFLKGVWRVILSYKPAKK